MNLWQSSVIATDAIAIARMHGLRFALEGNGCDTTTSLGFDTFVGHILSSEQPMHLDRTWNIKKRMKPLITVPRALVGAQTGGDGYRKKLLLLPTTSLP